ncbi:SPFH domain-containing protein [Mastigocoleus testarum]|uniref:Membrane protease subunit, stomatin/prohibitin n=1 Tax=Mastigocoleus testarum BC008 TaxID=371196 RepID=A0A0V7ZPM7_9CYAN|nr:SPFH domain-containing protein [Mastigocoleus testarum]KST66505.1 membrane protease subunit, stomatin/prohibitin [Mastigocoleus testarum BC008]
MNTIIVMVLILMGYALSSTKMINEGNEALVERFGKYRRKLKPGINFIFPLLDQIVMEDTVREQVLDIKPQNVITRDNVYLEVDGVVFWKIIDMEKSFYKIDDIQTALTNLVTVEFRASIAERTLEETIASRNQMNQALLEVLNHTSRDWGVEIIRVDIQDIKPPQSVQESMAEQNAAEMKKRAVIAEAEGERQAAIKKAEATRTSMQIIAEALRTNPDTKDILRYLVAQDYVDASQKLSESKNAKIVFMDPIKSGEVYNQIITEEVVEESLHKEPPENGNGAA